MLLQSTCAFTTLRKELLHSHIPNSAGIIATQKLFFLGKNLFSQWHKNRTSARFRPMPFSYLSQLNMQFYYLNLCNQQELIRVLDRYLYRLSNAMNTHVEYSRYAMGSTLFPLFWLLVLLYSAIFTLAHQLTALVCCHGKSGAPRSVYTSSYIKENHSSFEELAQLNVLHNFPSGH